MEDGLHITWELYSGTGTGTVSWDGRRKMELEHTYLLRKCGTIELSTDDMNHRSKIPVLMIITPSTMQMPISLDFICPTPSAVSIPNYHHYAKHSRFKNPSHHPPPQIQYHPPLRQNPHPHPLSPSSLPPYFHPQLSTHLPHPPQTPSPPRPP
jgi:hypothetical protein